MDEYAALAQRVVLTMDDVRGCLVLSRDGMVLGAYPEEDEQAFKPAWLKFVHVGEARRGFVEFSDQLWAYVHRGPYAAFVISGTGVRPGVLLDQLEQAVLAAEETRAKKGETLKVPDASSAPSGRPRTSLHPAETKAPEPAPEPVASAPPADQRAWNGRSPGETPAPRRPLEDAGSGGGEPPPIADVPEGLRPATPPEVEPVTPAGRPAAFATEGSPFSRLEAEQAASSLPAVAPLEAPPLVAEASTAAEPAVGGSEEASPGEDDGATPFRREPQRLVSAERAPDEPEKVTEEPSEVDRVMLAKEFSGLLQLNEDGDEDNS
jgi:hypothetical protein